MRTCHDDLMDTATLVETVTPTSNAAGTAFMFDAPAVAAVLADIGEATAG